MAERASDVPGDVAALEERGSGCSRPTRECASTRQNRDAAAPRTLIQL